MMFLGSEDMEFLGEWDDGGCLTGMGELGSIFE
jgi:hypothetical protein